MRSKTVLLAVATSVAALGLAACGGSSGGTTTAGGAHPLKLGGAPECPTRVYCEPGLKQTYGMNIGSFKALDVGGPLTVQAISGGNIDVGLVFTSDPSISSNGLVILTDDKHLQASDNIVPVLQKQLNVAPASTALNVLSSKLAQDSLLAMNNSVSVRHIPVQQVAQNFMNTLHLDAATLCAGKTGSGAVKVGAFNFSESELLAQLYSDALQVCGYSPSVKALGSREIVYPALKNGSLAVVPEYAATLTDFINTKQNGPNAPSKASGNINATMVALRGELPPSLVALTPSSATDQNAFAVTQVFAQQHNLKTLSDLAAYSNGH